MLSPLSLWERVRVREEIVIPAKAGIQRGCVGSGSNPPTSMRLTVPSSPSKNRFMLTLKAHAKINLTLEVLGRRDDGYHEVATIMQTVDLHDTVRLSPAADITLACDDPDLQSP